MGMQEFEEWSERIISGSLVQADKTSQKFALASMLMHLGPTEDHKSDAYFIHCLRKGAVNQVAHAVIMTIKEEQKKAQDALVAAQQEVTPAKEFVEFKEFKKEALKGISKKTKKSSKKANRHKAK